ncbi:MAG: transposase, partial [Wolbachia endosymbiont of Menacanthus eurysternus]|nr:transposase [Wolbachia endosymbiont of Menacanthus eurysternus]
DATEKGRQEGIQIGEERGKQEGIQIGHEKGRKEREIEVAKNLLKAGVSIDIIAQTTGLPKAEIVQLKEGVTS